MEFGFGMGIGASFSHPIAAAAASASVHPTNFVTTTSPECLYGFPSTDTLRIDDLLDLSNHDVFSSSSSASAAAAAAAVASDVHILPHQQNACAGVSGFSCNSYSHSSSFSDELYVPSEEAAQLEWLSKFIEDSFTDMPYPSNYLPAAAQAKVVDYPTAVTAPGHGARGRRSRNLQAPNQSSSSSSASSSSPRLPQETHCMGRTTATDHRSRDDVGDGARRCMHCASEKTPQWRTGPLGPKTLCNACGVRYKSGRLVPEYRPAASPTFVLAQHSNSHRKVMELRRQKEQLSGNHSAY